MKNNPPPHYFKGKNGKYYHPIRKHTGSPPRLDKFLIPYVCRRILGDPAFRRAVLNCAGGGRKGILD